MRETFMCAYFNISNELLSQGIYSLIQEESDPTCGRNCPSDGTSPSAGDEEKSQLDEGCKTDNSKVL